MRFAVEVEKVLYKWLRQGRRGSGILYSIASYLYYLVGVRSLYVNTRIVEIPWVLAYLRHHKRGRERILQVGDVLLHKGTLGKYEVELVDIGAEESPEPGLKVHKADIRDVSLPEGCFDIAISISTLEHIGVLGPRFPDGDKVAVEIISRALKPDGLLLLTVPFGKLIVMERFRVYDTDRLKWLLRDWFTVTEESYLVWNGFRWEKKSHQDAERVGFLKHKPDMSLGVALVKARKVKKDSQ